MVPDNKENLMEICDIFLTPLFNFSVWHLLESSLHVSAKYKKKSIFGGSIYLSIYLFVCLFIYLFILMVYLFLALSVLTT